MNKASISSFVYCKDIKEIKNDFEEVNQITVLPYLNLEIYKKRIPLRAICVITGINFHEENTINIYFIAPNNEILINYENSIKPDNIKDNTTPDALLLNIALDTDFNVTGDYETKVVINGISIGEFTLKVIEKWKIKQ